jgi:hypothetical protein
MKKVFYIINQVDKKGNQKIYDGDTSYRTLDEAIEFAEKMMSEKGTPHFVTTYRGLDLLFKQISQSQG